MTSLRTYQRRALDKFATSPARSVLIVAPTGAGKGTMATELLVRLHRARQRAVFLAHRVEIVDDIASRLRARSVGTAQTFRSDRYVRAMTTQHALCSSSTKPVDLLVVDEAHHYAAEEWSTVLDKIPAKRIVGFTATPERADGKALGDAFDQLIETVSYTELLELGLIVPARVLRPAGPLQGDLAQHPVDAYLRHCPGERALFFLPRVEAAEECAARLAAASVRAEVIVGTTKRAVRADALGRLDRGELTAVCSVNTLTEGIDVPSVSVCVLARPCAHPSTYVQIVGRVLRAAPGKTEATLIDLVGASHAHGLPGEDMVYSLSGRPIRRAEGQPREYVEPEPAEVLDVPLVTVRARRPRDLREAKVRGGFVYHDRAGFYSMRWTDAGGTRRRLGLCTKERTLAEGTLHTLRIEGETAARAEVLERKRRRSTLLKNNESSVWHLSTWNDARTRIVKISLHTRDRAEAEMLRELYSYDRDGFEQLVSTLRAAHEETANRGRVRSLRASHRARRQAGEVPGASASYPARPPGLAVPAKD